MKQEAPIPSDEAMRLHALDRFKLSNMARESEFDELSHLAADVLEVPIALVTIIDDALQCYAGVKGMAVERTPREASFCAHTILGDEPLIVRDALEDDRFRGSILVTGEPFIRFYAGVPIKAGRMRVGSLCVIDTVPRDLDERALQRLRGLARVAERLIESRLDKILRGETKRRLADYVEAMPVAVAVYDAESRFVLSNVLYRELFFSDRDARVPEGLEFRDLLSRMAAEGPAIRIEGGEGDWISQRIALRAARTERYEMLLDEQRWLQCREVQVEGGGLVATFSDVTELKERELALALQSALLRTTLESIDEGVAVFDRSACMVTCSEAYFRLLELPAPLRQMGTPLAAIVDDLARRGFLGTGAPDRITARVMASLERGGSRRSEVQTPSGRTLDVTRMVAEDGRLIVTCQDVTERREVERMKDEFVSTVSHELRTPLTSIAGSLGLLAGGVAGELPQRAARLVEIAHKNVDRLARLVNDLLDIDKIESGQMQFRRELLDLNALALQAVEQNRPYADKLGVQLECRPAAAPVLIEGDPDRLLQVAANLISNAAKYSPAGETVCVACGRHGRFGRLSVEDQGPGVPEHFRSRLFRRFAQADASDRRAQQGTGLGLSIALAIVERHGGGIEVDSMPGAGTKFHVDLPSATGELDETPSTEARPRYLVCEDDPSVADVLRRLLSRDGALVEVAGSRAAARERIREQAYDALVLDLILPDGNGLDLLRELRASPDTKHLPVIVVSAAADEAQQSVAAGGLDVLDWIGKPVDLGRLARAVANGLRGGRRPRRVLHVEDERDTGDLVRLALADFAEVDVAEDLADARARLAAVKYDAAILDLALPDGSGAELIPDLVRATGGPVPVVIFSASDAPEELTHMVAHALTKSRKSIDLLVAAVRDAAGWRR